MTNDVMKVIADVPDFWMDHGDGAPMELGEHNADRIVAALDKAGYVIASKVEVDRMRTALELIAGSAADKLQAMQARSALPNIGP